MCVTHEEEISANSRGEDGSAPADDSSMAKARGIISFRNALSCRHSWLSAPQFSPSYCACSPYFTSRCG